MRKISVLCVDDEYHSVNLLITLSKSFDFVGEVCGFTSSEDALNYATNHPFDIAFLDVDMPVMDGTSLARQLRALYPRINIIMATAYPQYACTAFENDCSGYMLKPITREKMDHQFGTLRFPPFETASPNSDIVIRCFGVFTCTVRGAVPAFTYTKTEELLAYLVHRRGAECTNKQIVGILWNGESGHEEYLKRIKRDLIDTFAALTDIPVILRDYGSLAIDTKAVRCDLYDYLDGNILSVPHHYLSQYPWAEEDTVLQTLRRK